MFDRWNQSVVTNYGRKLGWLRHHLFRLIAKAGGYRHFEKIDWDRIKRMVFVCTGNISRSPYAEARARASGVEAVSCGLEATSDSVPDRVAVKHALQRGLDLSTHRPQPLGRLSPGPRDLLVALEPWQGRLLLEVTRGTGAQVTLLGLWSRQRCPHIEDPYGLADGYYQSCFALIDEAVENLVKRLVRSSQRSQQRN